MWMMREDTECIFYSDGIYNMLIWDLVNPNPEQIMKNVNHCFRILRFLGAPTGFCVNWWRIPLDRKLKPVQFPTRAEVNGGWARHNVPEVFIFRLEEWDRVLIHECIHAFNWDVLLNTSVKSCLNNSLGGEINEALFEAATELNAEWLWCVIHSPSTDIKGATWDSQTNWQQKQAFAILARYDNIWKEDTSVFAYYVLKAVLALDITNFLLNWLSGSLNMNEWCMIWSTNKDSFMKKALDHKNTIDLTINMRMTNPDLEQNI